MERCKCVACESVRNNLIEIESRQVGKLFRQYKDDKRFLAEAKKDLKVYHPFNSKHIPHWIPYQIKDAFPFLVTWPVIVPKHMFMPLFLAQKRVDRWNKGA